MPALTIPALVAAALLIVAGAAKAADPANTVGALRALGLPGSDGLVRAGAVAEAALGAAALVAGGPVWWAAVAASYLAFAGFVVAALRAGTMVGTCGCFGHEDTPPHPVHVVLDAILAAVAVAAAAQGLAPLADAADHPGGGLLALAVAAGATWLAHAAFVDLPRALARTGRQR